MALPKHYIPRDLTCALQEIKSPASIPGTVKSSNKYLPKLKKLKNVNCLEISEHRYQKDLELGLYLEEYQRREDMNKFETDGCTIKKMQGSQRKFKFCIKGLDEDNSTLNVSDSLKVYKKDNPGTVFYLKVSKICNGYIIVTSNKRFEEEHSDLELYHIKLIFNNYTFQCSHYALSVVTRPMISNYFFPKKTDYETLNISCTETFVNDDILNNPEQKKAVYNIVNKSALPAPYILYGPPGTGKTSTLVEAICQIWKKSRDYILICAPSNAACDVITTRLLDYIPSPYLYRVYSQSQEYDKIDVGIKKCCNYDYDGTANDLNAADFTTKFISTIFISTICTSLRFEKFKLPFSYIFIDEASQVTLADAFLPLCNVIHSSQHCQIVMSGDHQQLGPIIRSKLAEPILGQSILEKLMKHEPYEKNQITGYDPRYITMLVRNFRSTKEIIHVPNELFYDKELIACSKTKLSTFPVAFYAVEGKENKLAGSKSKYNEDEISEVLDKVKEFVGKNVGNKKIGQKDIGIVTPFSLQVSQIRKKLDRAGLKDVDVGTVEIYQGQEKEVIIVTTVRSKTFIHEGIEHIGFLSNPRRFNVALTRAKTFLAVVGSPTALGTDKYWQYFLKFCRENNAYHDKNELCYPMQNLSIDNESRAPTNIWDKILNYFIIGYSMIINIWILFSEFAQKTLLPFVKEVYVYSTNYLEYNYVKNRKPNVIGTLYQERYFVIIFAIAIYVVLKNKSLNSANSSL